MNLSSNKFAIGCRRKIPIENVVVVGDLAIPFVFTRQGKGSDAGHNGQDIQAKLGRSDYPGKFGIGDDFPKGRQVDFFSAAEQDETSSGAQ